MRLASYIMNVTEKQFIQAYEDHVDSLFRYCAFKVDEREVAKDLVQDTFCKVWVYIAEGNKIQNLKALLYTTLSRTIIDYYRKKKAVSLDSLSENGFDVADDNTKISLDQIDGQQAIALIQKLPEEYRDVIFMKYVNELDLKEIAEILGERENTIAVRIHRGIKMLKELYI